MMTTRGTYRRALVLALAACLAFAAVTNAAVKPTEVRCCTLRYRIRSEAGTRTLLLRAADRVPTRRADMRHRLAVVPRSRPVVLACLYCPHIKCRSANPAAGISRRRACGSARRRLWASAAALRRYAFGVCAAHMPSSIVVSRPGHAWCDAKTVAVSESC